MNVFKKIFEALKKPKAPVLIVTYLITVASLIGVVLVFTIDIDTPLKEAISYAVYALSAIGLSYSVYTIVIFVPKWKKAIVNAMNNNATTKRLLENYGYRMLFSATFSFLFGMAYGTYFVVLAIMNKSVWYGVLGGFYLLIALARVFVVLSRKKGLKSDENEPKTLVSYAKTHINCGTLLIVASLAITVAVLQMVLINKTFSYNGLMIYVAATYAFYKITMAIINLLKKKTGTDLNIRTVREINLADAMVSILALQTGLLAAFGEDLQMAVTFNAITGGIVCVLIAALGIHMIIVGARQLNSIELEDNRGK